MEFLVMKVLCKSNTTLLIKAIANILQLFSTHENDNVFLSPKMLEYIVS